MRERLLVHGVLLAGLAAVVAVVFALVVLGIGRVPTSGESTLLAFAALAAAVTALMYAALRGRLEGFANRLVRRDHGSGEELLRSFGGRTASGLPIDELLLQLAESLRTTLDLSLAEVWTSSGPVLGLTAADPPASTSPQVLGRAEEAAAARAGVVGRTWVDLWMPEVARRATAGPLRVAAMTHAHELLGLIVVARDPGRPEFAEDDEALLGQLAGQAALAVHGARLGSALEASMEELRRQDYELRASRARVVTAADAERRRIERNLHDGAQQHLIGLAVNLRVARELAESDPGQARALLEELAGDVHATLDDIRDLAHGIYPPLLVEHGLAQALTTAIGRARIRGRVSADGIGRYGPEVEATVYFCVLEGLQNAAKHAGEGARVQVRLWEEDATLLFEVADDGRGFDGRANGGFGLTTMRDRVGALGGRLRIDSSPQHGTRVTGGVPL